MGEVIIELVVGVLVLAILGYVYYKVKTGGPPDEFDDLFEKPL